MSKTLVYLSLVIVLLSSNAKSEMQDGTSTAFLGGSWNKQDTYVALSTGSSFWVYDVELDFVVELDAQLSESSGEEHIYYIRWSPDGEYLAVASSFEGFLDGSYTFYDYVIVWDAISWQRSAVIKGVRNGSSLAWNPVDHEFAVITGTYNPSLEIYDAATGMLKRTFPDVQDSILGFDWNPEKADEMIIASNSTLQLWNPITLERQAILTSYHSGVAPKYNPQTSQIAFLNANFDVEIWDTETQQLVQTVNAPNEIIFLGWISDDLVTREVDKVQRRWNIVTDQSSIMPNDGSQRIWNSSGSAYLLLETDAISLFDGVTDELQTQTSLIEIDDTSDNR